MEQESYRIDILHGDRQAYSAMYIAYYKSFFNYGRKFTGDTTLIEDVIQDVLMDVWANRQRLAQIKSLKSYLLTAFRNALFVKIRRLAAVSDIPDEPEFGAEHFIIQQETDARLREQLQAAFRKLTSRQREAIFLRFYEDLSYEETARIMGITVKATYKIMARALLELKDMMALSTGALLSLLTHWSGK